MIGLVVVGLLIAFVGLYQFADSHRPGPTRRAYRDADRLLRARGDRDAAMLRCWIEDSRPRRWRRAAPVVRVARHATDQAGAR